LGANDHPVAARTARALPDDERGAIALVALFMAVFLTALVYYVAGIGESVLQRERMQDAADGAAFSAAVLHARGMNTLVLVNMVMAALLAVLVALKLVELVITIAILAIAIASFFAPGLAGAIPPLAEVRQQVKTAHDQLRPSIYGALDALHTTARGIRVIVPAASQLRVIASVGAQYGPPVRAGFALPPRATLPTQDGRFSTLCDRAGQYTGDLTSWALGKTFMPEAIAGEIGDAVEDLTQSRADWFCGTDGHPPRTKVEHKYQYPFLAARERCKQLDSQAEGYAENDADEHARLCAEAERDEEDSEPSAHSGKCETRCGADGPYEERSALARYACAPDQDGDNHLYAFRWQERRYERTYVHGGRGWLRESSDGGEEHGSRYVLASGHRRPCGQTHSRIGRDWEVRSQDPDTGAALPVCSNAEPPRRPAREGTRRTLAHVDVTRIFDCKRKVVQRYDLGAGGADQLDSEQAETKVPQDLLADAVLGEAPFQIRAAVIGDLPRYAPEGVQRIATWRRAPAPDVIADALPDPRELGRVAIAQAEYFYALEHPKTPPADFMWSMRWQARLRRVQLLKEKSPAGSTASQPDEGDERAERDEHDKGDESEPAALLGLAPDAPFGSLVEACDAVAARLRRDDGPSGRDGAQANEHDDDEEERSPCAALARAVKTESLH
jgi:hypothetical protein